MNLPDRARLRALATRLAQIVAAVLVVIGGTVVVFDSDGPGPKPARTITIPRHIPLVTATVDSADPGRAPDTALSAPAPVVDQAQAHLEAGLHDESPAGVPAKVLDANDQAEEISAQRDDLPVVQPAAAPSQRGCLSRFVQNYSSRRGIAPRWLDMHETVSPNVPGWADVNAIGALFDRASSAASSSYTLDREGHCLYLVRESDKPWTQAAANPWAISFEIINTADRARDRNLIDGPGRKLLLRIMNDASKRWDIPLRVGRSANCTPLGGGRAGVLDHASHGMCAGGHVDTSPWRGTAKFGQAPRGAVAALARDARRLCERRYRAAHKPTPTRCRP